MNDMQIRTVLLYEFKMGGNAAQTARNLNRIFGKGTTSERNAQRWFHKFKNGEEDIEDQEGRGRNSAISNDNLKSLVENDPRTTVRELASELCVSAMTVSNHLRDIGKSKKLDKWVPHELTENQKLRRLEVSSALLLRNKNEPFLDRIVTCDEKWILYDNRRRSAQWLDRHESPKQFPKPKLHQRKVLVTVWWSSTGLIHYSFLKCGETITAEKYCHEIEEMNQKLKRICPALVNRKGPVLLHDNARPHVAQSTVQKLIQLGYETLPHPAYSPDLSPTDYHFFKHLDKFFSGRTFTKEDAVIMAFEDFVTSRTPDFYSIGINKLVTCWEKCVQCNGFYFN